MNLFEIMWEAGQQRKINETTHEANKIKHVAKDASSRVADLEHSIDKLLLINRALWEIIQKYHPMTNDYLIEKIKEIDLRDGKLDGKLTQQSLMRCSSCGQTLSKKHVKCIYCGAAVLGGDPFDKVR